METILLALATLSLSSLAQAAVGPTVGVAGKVRGLRAEQVELQVGKKVLLIPRTAFAKEGDLRPDTQAVAWLNWLEIEKLREAPGHKRTM